MEEVPQGFAEDDTSHIAAVLEPVEPVTVEQCAELMTVQDVTEDIVVFLSWRARAWIGPRQFRIAAWNQWPTPWPFRCQRAIAWTTPVGYPDPSARSCCRRGLLLAHHLDNTANHTAWRLLLNHLCYHTLDHTS